jgi:predicted helicase
MKHILNKKNLVLITTRQQSEQSETWGRAFVSNLIFESSFISNKTKEINYGFPLWYEESVSGADLLSFDTGQLLNINLSFLSQLNTALNYSLYEKDSILDPSVGKKVFTYIYAILNSTVYRKKYANFLRLDFPRIPIIKNIDLFNELSAMGEDLVNISVSSANECVVSASRFIGQAPVKIEKISWAQDTIWLDKALTVGFKEVPEIVWKFEIGCYQVCEKWLKDRKGQVLTATELGAYEEILHKIVKLIKITESIDKAIQAKGEWKKLFFNSP